MRFWTIIGFIVALNLGVAGLMFLGHNGGIPTEKPLRTGSALSTRNMAPAKGAPYNFAQMAMGAVIVGITGIGLGVFLRKQKREPAA